MLGFLLANPAQNTGPNAVTRSKALKALKRFPQLPWKGTLHEKLSVFASNDSFKRFDNCTHRRWNKLLGLHSILPQLVNLRCENGLWCSRGVHAVGFDGNPYEAKQLGVAQGWRKPNERQDMHQTAYYERTRSGKWLIFQHYNLWKLCDTEVSQLSQPEILQLQAQSVTHGPMALVWSRRYEFLQQRVMTQPLFLRKKPALCTTMRAWSGWATSEKITSTMPINMPEARSWCGSAGKNDPLILRMINYDLADWSTRLQIRKTMGLHPIGLHPSVGSAAAAVHPRRWAPHWAGALPCLSDHVQIGGWTLPHRRRL